MRRRKKLAQPMEAANEQQMRESADTDATKEGASELYVEDLAAQEQNDIAKERARTEDGEGPQIEGPAGGQTEESPEAPEDPALAQALKDRDMYKDALVRERADFENYKKRNATLSATSFSNGVESAVSAVLPVLDNFERALAAPCTDTAYVDGMEMIMRQFKTALESLGVSEIDTSGDFDPNVHHAVMQVEDENLKSNQIAETLQKGYAMKDKVVRPAMVKVAK